MRNMSEITKIDFENILNKAAAIKPENGFTLLHWACAAGCNDLASALCYIGVDINAVDVKGNTPLHYACIKGDSDIIKLLLTYKANTFVNKKGNTPFDYLPTDKKKDLKKFQEEVERNVSPGFEDIFEIG